MDEKTVNSTEGIEEKVEVNQKNTRLRNALIRALAALVAACILLVIPGFAIFTLIKGPEPISFNEGEEPGTFVSSDVNFFLGLYPEREGEVDRYAAMFVSGRIVSVRFTDRYLENVNEIVEETSDYLNMNIGALDKYLTVRGTTGELSESVSGMMYSWFDLNYEQLLAVGLPPTDDYAVYLSDAVLLVDTVDGYSENMVFVMTGISVLLLLYMFLELALMCIGFYMPKEELCTCGCEECADEVKTESAAATESTAEAETPDEAESASEEEPTTEDASAGEAND